MGKKYKRRVMLLAALCMTTVMNAQTEAESTKHFHIGAEAGISISNYTGSSRYSREGFYVGAHSEYELEDCYLAASLRLIRKGADPHSGDSDSDSYYEAYYVELPITIGFSGRLGKKSRIFGEIGPYIAVGIGGKSKGTSFYGEGTNEWNDNFFSKANDSPRRFDAGLRVGGGVTFGHVEIAAGYEIGFIPVWKDSNSSLSNHDSRNSVFTVGVAYMF